jgi:Uma2 family endonuclease
MVVSAQPASSPLPAPAEWTARWKSDPWTYEDLERLTPPDSWGFQILEGVLTVAPAPGLPHMRCVRELARLLQDAAPVHLEVGIAPYDFTLGDSTVEPDVFVIERARLGQQRSTEPPLLAVEVLSPTGRSLDLSVKREIYRKAGVPQYWIVDPDVPALTVLRLEAGRYVEVARVVGDERFDTHEPFPVTVVPARLRDS